jgi:carboxyl-terminal processing protease
MDRRPYPWARLTATVVVLLLGFMLGVVADRGGWLPGSVRQPPPDAVRALEPFWETWHLVSQRYVDREAVQSQRMARGAIRGLLASLGDVGHTTYLTPEDRKQFEESLKGELSGIGAVLTLRKGRPVIMQTVPNSPARAAGLRPGDVLQQVNGEDVTHQSLEQIVRTVRGPAGTTVRLRVVRTGESRPLDVEVTRAKVEVPSVSWHLLPGEPKLAHVALRSFNTQADQQLRAALEQVRKEGARGIVLDLRGDPGGLKEQAVTISSEFLAEGDVLIEVDAKGNRKTTAVKPGGVATDVPLVVLIDEGTASSAEILAGALQDHGRAPLVGMKTFGAGTVLLPFPLGDGSEVLLAVEKWLTPKGHEIWHQGISPDVEVALPEGAEVLLPDAEDDLTAETLAASQDKQLLKGLELLREKVGR